MFLPVETAMNYSPSPPSRTALFLACALLIAGAGRVGAADGDPAAVPSARQNPAVTKPPLDRSGRKRVGNASFYAKRFAGKKMADGTLMQPHGSNAASKTLPLGTTAKVTNVETGQSAVVTIQDRGPYVKGRIVDLSPATAKQIGMDHADGIAKVEVTPISVPLADGSVKAGAAAGDAPNH
jgi:rare lipoprotein A